MSRVKIVFIGISGVPSDKRPDLSQGSLIS